MVVTALGPDWEPLEVMRGEQEAYDLLYSGLDERQQKTYDMLVAATRARAGPSSAPRT